MRAVWEKGERGRDRASRRALAFLVYKRDAVRTVLEVSPAQPRNPLPPRLVQASRLLPRLPLARQVLLHLLPWHRPSSSLPGRGRVHFLRLQAGGVRQARVRRVRVKKRDARASTPVMPRCTRVRMATPKMLDGAWQRLRQSAGRGAMMELASN